MLRNRASLAITGTVCVFLLIVTGFVVNRRPSGLSDTALSGTQPSPKTVPMDGIHAPSSSRPSAKLANVLQVFSEFDGYGLASAQCDAEFKDLFQEIERSNAHRQSSRNITSSDIDLHWNEGGAVRAMIWRQKV